MEYISTDTVKIVMINISKIFRIVKWIIIKMPSFMFVANSNA